MTDPRFHRKDLERRRITERIKTNTAKECACVGCDRGRYKLAPYCTKHYNRYRRHGSPDGRIPTRKELGILDDLIRDWIEVGMETDKDREAFRKIWGSAVVTLRKPQSAARGLWFLEGDTRLTQRERADILLSNYQHRARKPLGMAMLRWMSCRLWAELFFQMPPAKRNFQRERTHFVNLFAGQYVIGQTGLSREITEEVTLGYQRSVFAQTVGEQPNLIPITEKRTSRKTLSVNKSANISRAIGAQLADAVGHAMGNSWQADHSLTQKAFQALGANNTTI